MALRYGYKQATKQIKEALKISNSPISVPIIMLSAQEDASIINDAMKAGACEFSMVLISYEANSDGQTKGNTL
jgi:response regulator of citrate/malate metabolism